MKKPFDPTNRPRPKGTAPVGRSENAPDEERPFAEIRKTLYDALRMLSLHRWAFFIPFSVVSCAAFILSLYYPRTYSATTSFERKNDPVMMNLPMSAGAASFKYFRNTMVRDLTSVGNMVEVVDNLGLTDKFERDAKGHLTKNAQRRRVALARSLGSTLKITTASPSEQIDIITVAYTGPDPTIGRKLVDEVKRTYIRRTMTWIHKFLTDQRDYFRREAQESSVELNKVQREDTRLRMENPHVDPVNPAAIALRLSQLESERRELRMRQREYAAEVASLQQRLDGILPPSASSTPLPYADGEPGETLSFMDYISPRAMRLRHEMGEIDRKIDELKKTRGMTVEHPDIVLLIKQRCKLERQFRSQQLEDEGKTRPLKTKGQYARVTADPSPAPDPTWMLQRTPLLAQLAALNAKLKDVTISLENNELNIEHLEKAKRDVYQKQEEFAEVSEKVAQAKQNHRQLEKTLATIEPAIKAIEQNRLLQFSAGLPARGSSIPVSPSATTVVLLALLAGVATGVIFVILAEVFDHVYRSSSQVARGLGLPMLESIDEIITAQNRRTIFVKRAVLNPAIVCSFLLLIGLTGSMAYLSIERPWTYEKLRTIPETAIRLFAGDSSEPASDSTIASIH